MIKEIYSNKNVTLVIRDDRLELWYLGAKYFFEYKGDIVDTLVDILNTTKENSYRMYKELLGILNIIEPAQNKTIKFDGTTYSAVQI